MLLPSSAPCSPCAAVASHQTANVQLEQHKFRDRGVNFILFPCGAVTGHPERSAVCAKIHFEQPRGTWMGKRAHPLSGSARMSRRSVSSGMRRGRARGPYVPAPASGQKRSIPIPSVGPPAGRSGKRNKSVRVPLTIGSGCSRADIQECKDIIKQLLDHPSSWPFRQPVDVNAFPDYYDIIPDRIDLGTIRVSELAAPAHPPTHPPTKPIPPNHARTQTYKHTHTYTHTYHTHSH